MYSPKINEELIPILYKMGKDLKLPMTEVVDMMVREGIARYDCLQKNKSICPLCGKRSSKIKCQEK